MVSRPLALGAEDAGMVSSEVLSEFSRNRLDGEPVPDDLKILLAYRDELEGRAGLRLVSDPDWAPWLDASHLNEAQLRDPDVVANRRATEEVCRLIAFIAADGEGQYFGYWRGPARRPVSESPIVFLDRAGQFHLCVASSFAEAVLAREYGRERFPKIRAWLRSLGIPIGWESPSILTTPYEKPTPKELHRRLFEGYRRSLSPQA